MIESLEHKPIYRLTPQLELDTQHGSLRRGGEEQYLRQQAFDILLYLVEQRERVVSKDDLNQKIWKGTAVTDSALAQCIFEIRKALGDDSREPRFIRTIPKMGYRFIGPVETCSTSALSAVPRESSVTLEMHEVSRTEGFALRNARELTIARDPRPVSRFLAAGLLVTISFLCGGFWALSRPATTEAAMDIGGFDNAEFSEQTGTFTATFDASVADFPMNSTMGLANQRATVNKALAVIVRFNPDGYIDARNGRVYAADSTIPYSVGVQYHFRFMVNIPAHTYSVFVTPAGGVEQTVGTNFSFRNQRNTVTSLNSVGVWSGSGTNTVCNFAVTGASSFTWHSFVQSPFKRLGLASQSSTITQPCTTP